MISDRWGREVLVFDLRDAGCLGGRVKDWAKVSEILVAMAHDRQARWKCGFPPFDSLPREEDELEISVWCAALSQDMLGELEETPDWVRPWILARLAVAAAAADREASERSPCPGFSAELLKNMLVASWHQALRNDWGMMVTLELEE